MSVTIRVDSGPKNGKKRSVWPLVVLFIILMIVSVAVLEGYIKIPNGDGPPNNGPPNGPDGPNGPNGKTFTVWAVADFHTGRLSNAKITSAINDVKSIATVDMVVSLGDLTNTATDGEFNTYKTFKTTMTVEWYDILGNHDVDYEKTQAECCGIMGIQSCYEVKVGNIVFLMVSDIGSADGFAMTAGEVTNEQWQWINDRLGYWTGLQVNIILCTHQPPRNSVSHSDQDYLVQINKNWEGLMDSYPVDLWLNGHIHSASIHTNFHAVWHGCHVLSCSSLADWCKFGANQVDSTILYFTEGETEVYAHHRIHTSSTWDDAHSIRINLAYPVEL